MQAAIIVEITLNVVNVAWNTHIKVRAQQKARYVIIAPNQITGQVFAARNTVTTVADHRGETPSIIVDQILVTVNIKKLAIKKGRKTERLTT